MRVSPLLLLLGACTGSGDWQDADDCRALSDAKTRDECFVEVTAGVFGQSAEAGEAMVREVSDPLVRDYILLKVTREVDSSSYRYCDQIQTPELATRCRTLVQRPHLHRERVAKDAQGVGGGADDAAPGGPGGPPPGGPGGPPPGGPGGPPPGGPMGSPDGAKGPPLPSGG